MITIPMKRANAQAYPDNAAKVICEALFHETNRFEYLNIRDLFCDLRIIEIKITNETLFFFWGYEASEGSTWVCIDKSDLTNGIIWYKISLNEDNIRIEKVQE